MNRSEAIRKCVESLEEEIRELRFPNYPGSALRAVELQTKICAVLYGDDESRRQDIIRERTY